MIQYTERCTLEFQILKAVCQDYAQKNNKTNLSMTTKTNFLESFRDLNNKMLSSLTYNIFFSLNKIKVHF